MKYLSEDMYVRLLDRGDLDRVLELQEKTILELEDRSVLRRNTPEILAQALSDKNLAIGTFIEDNLIAVAIAVDPVPPETDLRKTLQTHFVDNAMDLKLVIVQKEYRGNGLQKVLMYALEQMAVAQGYTHFCTSVSPNNKHSIHNMLSMGYDYDHQELLYDGLLRNVYVKTLKGIQDETLREE